MKRAASSVPASKKQKIGADKVLPLSDETNGVVDTSGTNGLVHKKPSSSTQSDEGKVAKIAESAKLILEALGEDPERFALTSLVSNLPPGKVFLRLQREWREQ